MDLKQYYTLNTKNNHSYNNIVVSLKKYYETN